MPEKVPQRLSRRERQIMDIVYARGEAAAAEVQDAMADAPSYSAVRALLRVLVEKGHLSTRKEGLRLIYGPTRPRTRAARDAMRQVLSTFYEGAAVNAVAALLDLKAGEMSDEDFNRLSELIDKAKKEGR